MATKRALAVLTPSTIFHVGTHRGVNRRLAEIFRLPFIQVLLFASRTHFACAASPPAENSCPETRLHSSATYAELAASSPSTAEERDASTCGFNSGFRRGACSFAASSPATAAAPRDPRLQLLSGSNVGPPRILRHIFARTAPPASAHDWDILFLL